MSLLRRRIKLTILFEFLGQPDPVVARGDDEQFSQRLALSEPYHVIAQILKEYHQKQNKVSSVGINDLKLISDLLKDSGLTEPQILQEIWSFQEEMNIILEDKEKEMPKVYDAFCQLFNRDFFQELVKALLKEYGLGVDIPYSTLFSGATRTLATEKTLTVIEP